MPNDQTFPADNPYQSPVADESGQAPTGADLAGTVEVMRQARPWVMLIGILGLVAAGFMVVAFLVTAVFYSAPGGLSFGAVELLLFVVFGLMLTVPSTLMIRYANRLSSFVREPSVDRLNKALATQRAFWRLIGIFAVIIMAIYLIVILMAVIGALAASL